jgi:putative hemolysin
MEQNIVERVFTLGDRKVSSLMTHRQELVTFDIQDELPEVRTRLLKDMHSVYPVVDGSPDQMLGVVTLKDLVAHMDEPGFTLRSILRQPQYLVEGLSAYKALDKFKRSQTRYGLVTDEFGSVEGIITINDILEALVGDVSDFHGSEFTLVERADGSLLVDGQYPLHELLGRLGESALARDVEVNTIGGLFLYMNGSIPKAGDKIQWMSLDIEVVDMDGARIDKVIVRRLPE